MKRFTKGILAAAVAISSAFSGTLCAEAPPLNFSSGNQTGISGLQEEPVAPGTSLPHEVLNAVVVISGEKGGGTGFICKFDGETFIATNQHVLGSGRQLTIRANGGELIHPKRFFAATDADVALIACESIPDSITPLEFAALPNNQTSQGDAVIIPGNSKGDGVVTQTPGKLLAVGPQRIEVDNPVYGGNSGSPIVHLPTMKVIGILTEAELIELDAFSQMSFRSKNSAIKSTIRYFGHRVDSIQGWEAMDWNTFHHAEELLERADTELRYIFAYFTDSSDSYKQFAALHTARNQAASIWSRKRLSKVDKIKAWDSFLSSVRTLAMAPRQELERSKVYFCQKRKLEGVIKMSDAVASGVGVLSRDNHLTTTLLHRGD